MGGGKALKAFGGRPLWSYGYDLLCSFCTSVQFVGECPELDFPKLVEEKPGQGPLGGIVTALRAAETEWCFILALDYPLLDRDFVEALWLPDGDEAVARLPCCGSQKHPLCGFYRRRAADFLPSAGSVWRALDSLEVKWVDFGADERFLNVNRLEDLRIG